MWILYILPFLTGWVTAVTGAMLKTSVYWKQVPINISIVTTAVYKHMPSGSEIQCASLALLQGNANLYCFNKNEALPCVLASVAVTAVKGNQTSGWKCKYEPSTCPTPYLSFSGAGCVLEVAEDMTHAQAMKACPLLGRPVSMPTVQAYTAVATYLISLNRPQQGFQRWWVGLQLLGTLLNPKRVWLDGTTQSLTSPVWAPGEPSMRTGCYGMVLSLTSFYNYTLAEDLCLLTGFVVCQLY